MALHNTIATPVITRPHSKDMLAEEAKYTPGYQPRHVKFADMIEGGFNIYPHVIYQKRWPYHQGLCYKATKIKLSSIWLHMNLEK